MRPHTAGITRHGLALCMLCGLAAPVLGAEDGAGLSPGTGVPGVNIAPDAGERLIDFHIPAQPLAGALDEYAAVSGRSAVFRSALVAGRLSSAVQGRHTAAAALRLLLEGTGLLADEVGAGRLDAFVLKADGSTEHAAAAAAALAPAAADDLAAYDGLVQAHVWEAFCEDARTAPGSYRALLRFGMDASGRVERARLLGSSGDRRRDAALLEVLHRVEVGQPPPRGMPQPLALLVLPRGRIAGQSCVQSH